MDVSVLANDEVRLGRIDKEQKFVRTEISIGDPHVAGLHQSQHVVEQGAFLGVSVRRLHDVGRKAGRGIHHDEGCARQWPVPNGA